MGVGIAMEARAIVGGKKAVRVGYLGSREEKTAKSRKPIHYRIQFTVLVTCAFVTTASLV